MAMKNVAQELWGPPFIGVIVGLSFYGVTLSQTIFYYKSFPTDPRRLKFMIAFLCVMDTLHVGCLCGGYWRFLIAGRTNANLLTVTPWTISASIIATYIIAFVVQTFFGYRVWKISHGNLILTIIIGITALVQIGAGMAVAAYIIIAESIGAIFNNVAGDFELISSVLCDVTITGSLVYYFKKHRTRVKQTEATLQKLMRITVNMGLLGAVAAFIGLVLFHTGRGQVCVLFDVFGLCLTSAAVCCLSLVIHSTKFEPSSPFVACVAAHFLMSKCYVNSLMGTLNVRISIRATQEQDITLDLSTFQCTTMDFSEDTSRSTGAAGALLPR